MATPLQRTLVSCLTALVATLACGDRVLAGTTGSISGTVTDGQTGAPIAGVAVSATSPSAVQASTTDAKGFYTMQGLTPDTYTVTFSKEGYETATAQGVTVIQDQTASASQAMRAATKVLGTVAVRSAGNLVQPNQPADVYTISGSQLSAATGGDDLHKTLYEYMQALPGVTANGFPGQPRVRGGEVTDLAYEFDGVPIQERIIGFFTTNLSNIGVSSVELYDGGYGAEYGNAGEGVLNSVIKTGTYPPSGDFAFGLTTSDYNHRLTYEYGSATPDRRFSYYFGFDGVNSQNNYDYGHNTYPDLLYGFFNGDGPVFTRDMVANFHFRPDARNDYQLLVQNGYGFFDFDYLLGGNHGNAPLLELVPCPGFTLGGATFSGGAGGTAANGQACPEGLQFQSIPSGAGNQWHHYSGIGKLQWDHSLNDHSLLALRLAENFNQYIFDQALTDPNYANFENNSTGTSSLIGGCPPYPYAPGTPVQGPNGDPTAGECTFDIEDFYGDRRSNMYVFNADYDDQISGTFDLKLGANYESDRNLFRYYLRNFFDSFGWPNNYLDNEAPTHLYGAYVQAYIHAGRFLLSPGVRYDHEAYGIPGRSAYQIGGGSPRFAGTYQFNDDNAVRFSYGTTDNLIGSGYVTRNNSSLYNPNVPGFNAQPQINHNADLMFEHQFADGVTSMRVGPWWHKADNYYSLFNPVIGTNPDGSPKFGPTVVSNAGHNQALGAEFGISHQLHGDGLSWWLTGTYDNYWTSSTGTSGFVNFPVSQTLVNEGFRTRDPSNPLFSGSISADWRFHGWEVLPFAYYQTKAFYNVYTFNGSGVLEPELISGAWWLSNVSVLKHFGYNRDTAAGVRITNVTNNGFNTTPCFDNSAGTGCYPFDGPQSGFVGPPNQYVNQHITDNPRTYEFFVTQKL